MNSQMVPLRAARFEQPVELVSWRPGPQRLFGHTGVIRHSRVTFAPQLLGFGLDIGSSSLPNPGIPVRLGRRGANLGGDGGYVVEVQGRLRPAQQRLLKGPSLHLVLLVPARAGTARRHVRAACNPAAALLGGVCVWG